jgi:hypothetical protein
MLTGTLLKIVSGLAVVAAILYLLHLYGNARYDAGVADQKATDSASMLTAYQTQQKTLQGIYDNSVTAANGAQAASDAVATGLDAIRAQFKGKTLAVITHGVCTPSADFVNQWNALSTLNGKK